MVDKNVLTQYADMLDEAKEVRSKIVKLECEIENTKNRINEIEAGEMVKDKVRGGSGGIQNYTIEGVPVAEYNRKLADLAYKRMALKERKSRLEELEKMLIGKTNDVEQFIASIDDSHIRRIISLRFVEALTWQEVAEKMKGNTEDSVRMAFNRFMENN
jgi:hypothetical protein